MRERWFVLVARFRDDNNVRANVFLAFAFFGLILYRIVFGGGDGLNFLRPEETQRAYNLYRHGTYVTDAELRSWFGVGADIVRGVWNFARELAWFFLKWMFWGAVGYRLWAWRDEIRRGWRAAAIAFSERREARASAAPSPVTPAADGTPAAAGVATTFGQELFTFARGFLSATVANIFTHRWGR